MNHWIGVKYKGSAHHLAAFAGSTDAKAFLAAIRKDEPGIKFVAFLLNTGEVLDW